MWWNFHLLYAETWSKIEAAGRVFIVIMAVPWASALIEAVKNLGT